MQQSLSPVGNGRRPLASLNADYPMYQRHLGWTFGYFTEASSTKLEELVWRQDEGKWGCADAAYEFPSMRPGAPYFRLSVFRVMNPGFI